MKRITFIIGFLFLTACSSTKFVDTWRNEEITSFQPKKLLVVGMTDNLTARKIFEEELKNSFLLRNINAVEGETIFDKTFTDSKKSEEEIDEIVKRIAEDGFDSVLITAVKGIDGKPTYMTTITTGYYDLNYHWRRFERYYYRFQDVYYRPNYYEAYKVYHVETSIYNINENENKSLIWVGLLDVVDPQAITRTVKDHVASIIKQLEREKLIEKYK